MVRRGGGPQPFRWSINHNQESRYTAEQVRDIIRGMLGNDFLDAPENLVKLHTLLPAVRRITIGTELDDRLRKIVEGLFVVNDDDFRLLNTYKNTVRRRLGVSILSQPNCSICIFDRFSIYSESIYYNSTNLDVSNCSTNAATMTTHFHRNFKEDFKWGECHPIFFSLISGRENRLVFRQEQVDVQQARISMLNDATAVMPHVEFKPLVGKAPARIMGTETLDWTYAKQLGYFVTSLVPDQSHKVDTIPETKVRTYGVRDPNGMHEEDHRIYVEKELDVLSKLAKATYEKESHAQVKLKMVLYMPWTEGMVCSCGTEI
jgi:hypothetical protein